MLVEFGDADKAVTFLLDVARQGGVTDSPYIWFEVSKLWLHHLNQVERALAGFCRANTLNSWNPDIWGNIYTRFTIPWHLIILPPLFFFFACASVSDSLLGNNMFENGEVRRCDNGI